MSNVSGCDSSFTHCEVQHQLVNFSLVVSTWLSKLLGGQWSSRNQLIISFTVGVYHPVDVLPC